MYRFNKCTIEKTSGEYVASGNIVEYTKDIMKIRVKDEYSHDNLNAVNLTIFNSTNDEFNYKADVYQIDGKNIILCNLKPQSSIQKRNHTRVNVSLGYTITHIYKDKKIYALEKPFDIKILNISAAGIYISSEENLNEGFNFKLVLCETREPVHLQVEVIRKDENEKGFNYACRFIDITEEGKDEIFRYVLEQLHYKIEGSSELFEV